MLLSKYVNYIYLLTCKYGIIFCAPILFN